MVLFVCINGVTLCVVTTDQTLQRWLYWREHLKYVWNVYCVATNHRWDLHTTETTGNERFPIGHGIIIFVLFKDTNCLNRNLKHRCSPRSVPRTASSTLFDFRKKSFRSQRDATATSFPCNDISHEDNKKWTIVMFSFLIAQSLLIFFCRTRGFDLCGLTIEPSNYYLLPTIRRNYRFRSLQKVWKLARQTVACVGPAHRLCNLFQNRSNLYSSLL